MKTEDINRLVNEVDAVNAKISKNSDESHQYKNKLDNMEITI